MTRFVFLKLLLGACCLVFVPERVNAQDFSELSLPQLQLQLNSILRTRRDEEKAFIASVIKLIEQNKLPRKLVFTSFKYVRNKKLKTNRPFVYFVQVLRFLGARENAPVPTFDFSIYSQTPRQAAARNPPSS